MLSGLDMESQSRVTRGPGDSDGLRAQAAEGEMGLMEARDQFPGPLKRKSSIKWSIWLMRKRNSSVSKWILL